MAEVKIPKPSEFLWTARTPDLSPLDYFVWGHVTEFVLQARPTNTEDIKTKILPVISAIRAETLSRVVSNIDHSLSLCIAASGGIIEKNLAYKYNRKYML